MNEQIILEELISLGLTEVEAQIYLHLLKNGSKTPLEMSRETNINRTKIYRLIDLLREKKLIEQFGSNRGLKLRAAPPSNLELLVIAEDEKIKRNMELLPNIISSLIKIPANKNEKFEVIHYRGIDGLQQMLWNALKSKEILLFGYENLNQFVGKPFADKVRREEVKRDIHVREIGNSPEYKQKDQSFYNSASEWEKVFQYKQISGSVLSIEHNVRVYDNTISIIDWKNGKVGIEITNKPLADMQRQIFWQFWKLAK